MNFLFSIYFWTCQFFSPFSTLIRRKKQLCARFSYTIFWRLHRNSQIGEKRIIIFQNAVFIDSNKWNHSADSDKKLKAKEPSDEKDFHEQGRDGQCTSQKLRIRQYRLHNQRNRVQHWRILESFLRKGCLRWLWWRQGSQKHLVHWKWKFDMRYLLTFLCTMYIQCWKCIPSSVRF